MSVNLADLRKAIKTVWDASGLDATFQALWDPSAAAAEHAALRDSQAPPAEPMPYCVLETAPGTTTDRMSGDGAELQEVRDLEAVFSVNARAVDGDPRDASEMAADLAEEVMKVFGGHPTVHPTVLTLDSGGFLLAEYQADVGVWTGDDEYQWRVTYLFRVDVPVAI